MRELFVAYLKGFSMGAADVVPGVSGGTIALIVGIYDRMIAAITAIDPREFRPVLRAYDRDARAELVATIERTDLAFLIALGLGVGTAIVVLSSLLHDLATNHTVPTYGFFFGLIAASAVVLYRQVEVATPRRLAIAAVGIGLAAAVAGEAATSARPAVPMVFLAGAIAICAMVLPGVSGAFFLILLGQYEYLTGTLSALLDALIGLANGGSIVPVIENGSIVGVFGLGATLGLFTMAHAVRYALDRYRGATLTFLVSLMVGGLRLPAERVARNVESPDSMAVASAVVAGVLGIAAVLLVDRYTDDLEYAAEQ